MVEKGAWTSEGSYQYAQQKDLRLIDDQLQKYFSDIYENAVKISETFETYRDLMGNLREAYQSSIANRANEIMRVFTAITTIFIPLTLITGIYGMNFEYMPELHWRYSYYVVIGIMVFAGALMFYLFRKRIGYKTPWSKGASIGRITTVHTNRRNSNSIYKHGELASGRISLQPGESVLTLFKAD